MSSGAREGRKIGICASGVSVRRASDRPVVAEIGDMVDDFAANQFRDDRRCALGRALAVAGDDDLRIHRRLIGLVDAGEILDLAGDGLLVEALRVARDADPRSAYRRKSR